ncbi:MAG: dihydrolipoamide acetyltransferase family protein [Spirochaetota bacterium]
MASEVLLPKQGNSVESCIIVEWKADEGSEVSKGDILMEVETDKATMEVESTADGVLLKQLVSPGDDVPVLSPIAIVGEAGEQVNEPAGGARATRPTAPSGVAEKPSPGPSSEPESTSARTHRGGAKISPRARRLADARGISYESLSGSGPGGRVMVRDVEAALESGAGGPAARGASRAVAGGGEAGDAAAAGRVSGSVGMAEPASETPIKGVRKLIAERMRASLASTAQLTMDASADARALLAYRKRLKASASEELSAISINDLVLFAVSRVLADFPSLNATFSDGVIRTFEQVDLGFAVDTPRGLMVPVVRAADRRSLVELTRDAHRLAAGCLEAGVNPDDLSGATFTVTNLGAFGIERFTPVLNVPQVAILGVCAITQRPAPDGEGTIPMMGLSLTIDHQVVDGAPAARFLQALGREIAQIDLTLAR